MYNIFSSMFAVDRQYHPTDLFSANLTQVRKADLKGYERIRKTIDRLLIAAVTGDRAVN
ncbi:MAG: hypothetical protein LC657_10520 [Desulfobacteraceae bacterium]|nr:hypothetical protein [Desulfobacteraceae bacterium]